MAPSAAPAAAIPQSQWPTPPSCPGSPLCDPATAADAATTSTATALVPGRAPATCDYTFHTTAGDVVIRAYRALSPRGADRLHTLVRHGYYDGSALYRVLPGFVAQFGVAADPTLARVYDYRANHPGAILEDDPAIVPPDGPGNDKLWLAYSAAYDERAGLRVLRARRGRVGRHRQVVRGVRGDAGRVRSAPGQRLRVRRAE
jgi:hypothetical protein